VALGNIETCPPDCVSLVLRDPSGDMRASISAGSVGGSLAMFAAHGGAVVGFLGQNPNNGPMSMSLSDPQTGNPRFTLVSDSTGGHFAVLNTSGQVRALLGEDEATGGHISLLDQNGNNRFFQ